MEISKSALRGLPEKTCQLFETVRDAVGIEDFLLVGGTALALRLQHRLSEDLDFVTAGKLNRKSIKNVLKHVHNKGLKIVKIEKVLTKLEFDLEGADADDYGQDWKVNGVKLTFFSKQLESADAQHALESRLISGHVPGVECGRIKVATEQCIFSLKSQVLAERLTSRDLFDLQTMIDSGRHSIHELFAETAALGSNAEFVKEKLIHGKLRVDDPPVNALNGNTVDVDSLRHWFVEQVNDYERMLAEKAKAAHDKVS